MSDSLSLFLKQQEVLKNIVPQPVRDLLETQRKFKEIYDSPAARIIRDSQHHFQAIFDSPAARIIRETQHHFAAIIAANERIAPMLAIRNSIVHNSSFIESFNAIDRISQTYKSATLIGRLAAINYDFQKLYEEESEESVIVIDESKNVKQLILDIYKDYPKIYTIEPREFEEMIAELLRNEGFEVELTKQTRDNGFDIIALRKMDRFSNPLKFLVECKRYKNSRPVGVEIIRSFKEVLSVEDANRGIIATTSYFTKDAIKKRTQTPYLLDYRDKESIIEWVAQYYKDKLRIHE